MGQYRAHQEDAKPSAIERIDMGKGDLLFNAMLDVGGKQMRIVGVENRDKTVTIATGDDASTVDIKVDDIFPLNNSGIGSSDSIGGAVLKPGKSVTLEKIDKSAVLDVDVTPGTKGNSDDLQGPPISFQVPAEGLKASANDLLSGFGITVPAEGKSGEINLTGNEQSDGSFQLTTDADSGRGNVDVTAWGFSGEEELGGEPMGASDEFRTKQMEFYEDWLNVQVGKNTFTLPIKDAE